jgi:serine/threonine-protein kinase
MRKPDVVSPVKVGDIVGGKFAVERVLGKGGMGVVVAALHVQLRTRVALKFLLPSATHDADHVARFMREARAAVSLRSEHTAKVLDVDKLPDGAPYIVMEYLDGRDLLRVLEREGPLSVPTAVDYVLQACEALAEAHSAGIVHRDIKPQNLFLTQRVHGEALVKVLDFGLARSSAASQAGRLTTSSVVMGSPAYMSPEQLRGLGDAGPSSDIWSLGVTLFELLTGALPFASSSVAELAAMVLREPPLRVRDLRAEVPEALEDAVAKCLEKEPDSRFSDVERLAAALEPFAGEARGAVRRIQVIRSTAGRPDGDRFPAQTRIPSYAETIEAPSPPAGTVTGTAPFVSSSRSIDVSPGVRSRSRWMRAGLALVAILAVAGLLAGSRLVGPRPNALDSQPAIAPASAPAPTDSSAAASAPATPPVAKPTTSMDGIPPADVPVMLSSATRVAPPPRVAGPSRRPAKTTPRRDCDPPYTLDTTSVSPDGQPLKRFKPWCL